jgi:hypothetical protein
MTHYNEDGMRMTNCCGACSTFDEDGTLYCKACYQPVELRKVCNWLEHLTHNEAHAVIKITQSNGEENMYGNKIR